jgi:hypothetical protein
MIRGCSGVVRSALLVLRGQGIEGREPCAALVPGAARVVGAGGARAWPLGERG